ncbi:MAG TPA: CBS domain-containing protein [Candidatus Nanoarchaeia archaeon]|nr:CBS domain-containing protein [Candidatus Nanoarchaeia archaeon]
MLDLKDIKPLRKRFSLTQTQLARAAGVSQSVVAKIEAGRIDPSYSTALRIFATLEQHRKKSALKADAIMHKGILAVKPNATVAEAVKLMQKHDLSQVLVCNPLPIGLVTETTVLTHPDMHCKVSEIMEAAPPSLAPDADLAVISQMLIHYSLLCIIDKGTCLGVITKSDVLKALV